MTKCDGGPVAVMRRCLRRVSWWVWEDGGGLGGGERVSVDRFETPLYGVGEAAGSWRPAVNVRDLGLRVPAPQGW